MGFCGSLCECLCAPFAICLNWFEKIWNQFNKMCIGTLLLICLVFSIGMLGFFSSKYDDSLANPTEFHYATCFISNIRSYKDDDENYKEITFVYGTSQDDWSQEGTYTALKDDWNSDHIKSDIGTCRYSVDPD
eukprot:287182_1